MRRPRRRYRGTESMGDVEFNTTAIFITPMLDMAFQLLTFFVFTYHPSALEGQFPISLAAGESAGPTEPQPKAPTPKEPTAVRPSITVTARARDRNRLGSLELQVAGVKEVIKGGEGKEDEPIDAVLKQLQDRLVQLKREMPAEDRLLLQASPGLRWEDTMRVLDACRRGPDRPGGRPIPLFPKVEIDLLR